MNESAVVRCIARSLAYFYPRRDALRSDVTKGDPATGRQKQKVMQKGVSQLKYMNIRLGAIAVLFATPLMADTPPPVDALPLSEVISGIETSPDLQWIDEVEWDDDGYWEIEYYLTDGSKVSVKLDPMTGEPRS